MRCDAMGQALHGEIAQLETGRRRRMGPSRVENGGGDDDNERVDDVAGVPSLDGRPSRR